MVHWRAFLRGDTGRILMSIVLGLGAASLFRKVCDKNNRNCQELRGPSADDLAKTYRIDGKCVQFTPHQTTCDGSAIPL
jgi:hypothetical protein